jgi:mannose PTS system EIIA component
MFGGTPNNISLAFLAEGKVEVVTGVNLPMLIKAATSRQDQPLAELAGMVGQAGRDSISVAGEILSS